MNTSSKVSIFKAAHLVTTQ